MHDCNYAVRMSTSLHPFFVGWVRDNAFGTHTYKPTSSFLHTSFSFHNKTLSRNFLLPNQLRSHPTREQQILQCFGECDSIPVSEFPRTFTRQMGEVLRFKHPWDLVCFPQIVCLSASNFSATLRPTTFVMRTTHNAIIVDRSVTPQVFRRRRGAADIAASLAALSLGEGSGPSPPPGFCSCPCPCPRLCSRVPASGSLDLPALRLPPSTFVLAVPFLALHPPPFPALHPSPFPALHPSPFPALHPSPFPALHPQMPSQNKLDVENDELVDDGHANDDARVDVDDDDNNNDAHVGDDVDNNNDARVGDNNDAHVGDDVGNNDARVSGDDERMDAKRLKFEVKKIENGLQITFV
ncbi:hypothetical protein BC938DRAFT_470689 [Jimgerdemannia flammicorona]|uniref:Uncharacterized protein n=1 Tax=Jimgerdemannia flammicorona TaxID=994334 RepID=A0A433Q9U5_9FUNG|nr:hypothetical protein BC938DRAFT_470689 [Jimgerdemannia flammicorona]